MRFFLILCLTLTGLASAFSQDLLVSKDYPQAFFSKPLDLAPSLSGTFGEIRGGHFHSGLDYRTNQREGYPVHAAADGYVSRLRVQNGGFGNAVYLNHPNGYTTVYAHLREFNPRIALTVKDYQYRKQSFDVDFPLLAVEIPVKKGEIIGWSGNTGSSGGPHLHFEIRDSATEETINPQLFGLAIPDRVKPVINGMCLYGLADLPFSEMTPRRYLTVTGSGGNYRLANNQVLELTGDSGFGIMTYDQNVIGGNHNGVYSIELRLDQQTVYASALEGFYFQNSRAVNSHVDYPALLTTGRRIQKSFVEPGNPLGIYKKLENHGIIRIADNEVHEMQYVVKDAAGNASVLNFRVRNSGQPAAVPAKADSVHPLFHYDTDNVFSTGNFIIKIPRGCLYSDLNFVYYESAPIPHTYSAVHHVHTRLIPVHENYELSIRTDSTLPESLRDKAVVVDARGVYQGGEYADGFVKANPRVFGNFHVVVDTKPPVITSVNVSDNKSFAKTPKMIFKIRDNLSGIRSFNATMDGQWVQMEFDPQTATLWHTFDERTSPGKHLFQLVVTDMKSNTSTFTATIYR